MSKSLCCGQVAVPALKETAPLWGPALSAPSTPGFLVFPTAWLSWPRRRLGGEHSVQPSAMLVSSPPGTPLLSGS
jgi:hypothetical protein